MKLPDRNDFWICPKRFSDVPSLPGKRDEQLMRGRDDFFSTRNVAATYKLLKKRKDA